MPPEHWDSDVVLVDGGTVHVRPIHPDDAERLIEFHARLSPETVYLRFFGAKPSLSPEQAERFSTVDHADRVALIAELGDELIGVARYDREPGTDWAEVAFVVNDAHQGRGIGTVLLEHLAATAREHGITRFVAETLPHNRTMLGVFQRAGFEERARLSDGVVHVEMLIEPTDASRAAVEEREHRAEAASVARLLTPRSVAVIGASRDRGAVGNQVLRNLLAGGFAGPVYPVHPQAEHVASVKAYPAVGDVPGPVDLAVIAVPAVAVSGVVHDCAAKGVAGLVVLTAGYAEIGESAAQTDLRDLARRNGMRLVGPNCIGVVNTAVGLNATFSPSPPVPGRVAMLSQSGAVGIALLGRSARMGLGVSTFVSVGNKADVSGNDLLQYWEDDPGTDVILLYLESFGNPRKFGRIARRVSRRKPIVAVKSGRTEAGIRAASSHTAAMASPDVAVDALFRQAGVIRVDTLDELFDMALVLGAQPLPTTTGVAVVTNSGGPGILATDACVAAGLDVPELSARTQTALREITDPIAAVTNPVDLVASATPEVYEQAIHIVLEDEAVGAALVIATPTFAAPPAGVADVLGRLDTASGKSVVACFLAAPDVDPLIPGARPGAGVPAFTSPEPAARALGRAARYAEWRRHPPGAVPRLDEFHPDAARGVIASALGDADGDGGRWLPARDVAAVFAAAGVESVPSVEVGSAEGAARAASELGFPVAVKAAGPDLVHKSDVGGVRLRVASAEEAAEAYESMAERIGERMTGGVVQRMAAPGLETIVGVVQDPVFGPLVMFGMGGTATELLGDRSFRILPLTDVDAAELVRSLRSSPLLFGYRNSPAVDVAALESVLQRVARLAGAIHEIAELEINPLIVSEQGAVAVDVRLRAVPAPPGPPPDLRRMPR